jgi:hypothetical protein
MMREPYFDSGGPDAEVIAVLNAISQVSARMARNMTILAKQRQSKKPAVKEKKKPELKLEDIRAVLAEKSRAGHTAAIRTLLGKYGASKLSGVDPKYYEALLKDVEVLDNAT